MALQVEGVRCRQHVNPLKKELQEQLPPQDWGQRFADPAHPLVIDIGCGPGRFLLALAQRLKGHNMLGLDIKEKVSTHPQHVPLRGFLVREPCVVPAPLARLHAEGEAAVQRSQI